MPNRAEILQQKFQDSLALPFATVLTESVIQSVLAQQGVEYREVLYTPMVTLWAWLSQVLDTDKSLKNAVSRVIAWLTVAGATAPSSDTGGYSKARKRLPFEVLEQLLRLSATTLAARVKPEQRWCGRRVKAFDGTSVSMSDTAANQKSYPQHSNQKAGCGFPLARLMVWFCVTTGAVLEVSISAFSTSEWELARQLYRKLDPEDVVVADSAYGTYLDMALVQASGADAVFRKQHARHCDFRRGKKLGIGDHIVDWQRPKKCPPAMSLADFEQLPAALPVREVHRLIRQPGFRPTEIILVTSLLDAKAYPKARLAELYQIRWVATEVNFKHLKTTLKMEMILAKTPDLVRKEIWVHLLAYNFLRTLIWQAAKRKAISPLRISLQGTRQLFNQFRPELAQASELDRFQLYVALLKLLTKQLLPLRPHRHEPRVTKQRPKSFPRMQYPRPVLKAKLAA
jgi:Transposase DDE domain